MFKNLKNDNGGILLEVLLMLAILMVIFPIMQRDIKKRTDNIRNQMVVKDLMKLKGAVETYLKKKPTFETAIVDIPFSDLVDSGLPKSFAKKNVLDQEYKVRVRVSNDADGNLIYDAIVFATGNAELSSIRLRDIVKDAKGYAGYVEDGLIYGPDWQLSVAPWNSSGDIDETSIVVKTGFSKKDYKYVSRVPGIGSSTMETNLYMNLNGIYNVNDMFVSDKAEFGSAVFDGTTKVSDVSVAENMHLQAHLNIGKSFNFPNGLDMKRMSYSDEYAASVLIDTLLHFKGSLYLSTLETNILRSATATSLLVSTASTSPTYMKIVNYLSFMPEANLSSVLSLMEVYVNSVLVDKTSLTSSYGVKFGSIESMANRALYFMNSKSASLNDVIVRDVNNWLIQNQKKIGGIDITETTPISVVLRGIFYEYGDVYKLFYNTYPANNAPMPYWYYNLYKRCEYNECSDTGWHK